MTDDLDARSRQLAKDILEALDGEDDPDRLAYRYSAVAPKSPFDRF